MYIIFQINLFFRVYNHLQQNILNLHFSPWKDKKIDGYPTIILIKGDQVVEFDAKPNEKSLTEFINTTL